MPRTEIDGSQVQDESLTGEDILDGTVQRKDVDVSTSGQSLITKLISGLGLILSSSSGVDAGTGDVTVAAKAGNYGQDYKRQTRSTPSGEDISGGSFQEYDLMNFNVTDDEANEFYVKCNFVFNHNSGSNDIRARLLLDGNAVSEEFRVEPKDTGTDQRYRGLIEFDAVDLSQGSHALSIEFRPSSASRISRIYRSRLQAMRTI